MELNRDEIKKGEIYYISNPVAESFGTELKKDRPAVIVSVKGKHSECCGAIVAFLTTKPKCFSDFHCTIHSSGRAATVLAEQMKYIDVSRIGKYIGTVTDEEMQMIDDCILKVHGIDVNRAEKELEEKNKKIKDLEDVVKKYEVQLCTYQGMLTRLYDRT